MKILSLVVENIKRIKAIHITPEGNAVMVTGKNGQGKTSTLDALEMVLGGKDAIPSRPVRDGEKTARIVAETEKYIITRHWTSPESSHLKLELKGEGVLGSPQKVLDQLVGDLSFDPLAFSSLMPRDQLKMLKDICKLDFTKLDLEFKQVYEDRKNVGKESEIHKANLEAFGELDDTAPELDIEGIRIERTKANNENQEIEAAARSVVTLKGNLKRIENEMSNIADEITRLQNEFDKKKEECANLYETIPELEKDASQEPNDLSRFDVAIEEWAKYEATQKQVNQKKVVNEKLLQCRDKWSKLDKRLKEIEDIKKKMVASAAMPITGLSLGQDEVLFNGIPFTQLSTSEQIRISMAIAMALNPKLKVVIIKNASLLDKAAMEELIKIAAEKDFQVWVERVAEGPEANCIYIEDGERIYPGGVSHDEVLKSAQDYKDAARIP